MNALSRCTRRGGWSDEFYEIVLERRVQGTVMSIDRSDSGARSQIDAITIRLTTYQEC